MTDGNSATLEDMKAGALVQGLMLTGAIKVVNIEWYGDQAVNVVFEDVQNAEPPAVLQSVGHKVQRPALVRAVRQHHWCPCPQRPFAPTLAADR